MLLQAETRTIPGQPAPLAASPQRPCGPVRHVNGIRRARGGIGRVRMSASAGRAVDRPMSACGQTRRVDLHPAVDDRLARLAADQRAAATAPSGPSLCIAPAGSGKTTTLVARAAWLVATGVDPDTIRAITFNKRAATELAERLDVGARTARRRARRRPGPDVPCPGPRDPARRRDRRSSRSPTGPRSCARSHRGRMTRPIARLDTYISRLKVGHGVARRRRPVGSGGRTRGASLRRV